MAEDEKTEGTAEQKLMFMAEMEMLGKVRNAIMQAVMQKQTPTASNLGRQTIDNLDACQLFLGQLGYYMSNVDEATERAVEEAVKQGKIVNFPGSGKEG